MSRQRRPVTAPDTPASSKPQVRELTHQTATWRVTRNPADRLPGFPSGLTPHNQAGGAVWRRRYTSLDITIWRKETRSPSSGQGAGAPKATWRVVIL